MTYNAWLGNMLVKERRKVKNLENKIKKSEKIKKELKEHPEVGVFIKSEDIDIFKEDDK